MPESSNTDGKENRCKVVGYISRDEKERVKQSIAEMKRRVPTTETAVIAYLVRRYLLNREGGSSSFLQEMLSYQLEGDDDENNSA